MKKGPFWEPILKFPKGSIPIQKVGPKGAHSELWRRPRRSKLADHPVRPSSEGSTHLKLKSFQARQSLFELPIFFPSAVSSTSACLPIKTLFGGLGRCMWLT